MDCWCSIGVAQNPVAELGDAGIDPRLVYLCASHSPTHQASQEKASRGHFTYQRASRVSLKDKTTFKAVEYLILKHFLIKHFY